MATNRTGNWGWGSRSSRTTSRTSTKKPVQGYQTFCNNVNNKIASYRCLTAQATGPARYTRPSPATLSTFSKWIEKGAIIHKVSATQVKRWSKTSQACTSAASAKTVMSHRFGKSTIKAVTSSKTGGFLVATTPVWKGKSFKFPH